MILFAWLNLLILLKYFNFVGIYIIMFEDILMTLMKGCVVFIIFIAAFGFGYNMLLIDQVKIFFISLGTEIKIFDVYTPAGSPGAF